MDIQISTDKNVEGTEQLAEHVRVVLHKRIGRMEERITRVEVHLGDENGAKAGQKDHRCMIEVRPRGLDPVALTHYADNLHQAIDGAAERMERTISEHFAKLDAHR